MNSLIRRAHAFHVGLFTRLKVRLAPDLLPLLARLVLAGIFWRSLLTKVSTAKLFTYTELINDFPVERAHLRLPVLPLELRPATLQQFRNDFALPVLSPEFAAVLASWAELVLPVFLVLGLATRLSALGLLGMTLVIQVFVFPDAWWSTHAVWVVLASLIVLHGPGRLSLDHLVRRFFAP